MSFLKNYVEAERRCKVDMLGLNVLVLMAALTTLLLRTPVAARTPVSALQSTDSPHPTKNGYFAIPRVQSGVDDTTGKYPYVVAVLSKNKFRKCTGILFAPTWVLSSAHCKSPAYVQYGNMTVQRESITSIKEILKIIQHPSYKSYRYLPRNATYNDIGLMLVDEIKLGTVARLSGLDYRILVGYQVEYAGYGLTDISSKSILEHHEKPLQLGGGMIASCHDVEMQLFFNPKLCVVPQCAVRQSMMPGDSGGPVFVDGKVVGINVGIIYASKISICTPLSPYLEWIHQVISGSEVRRNQI